MKGLIIIAVMMICMNCIFQQVYAEVEESETTEDNSEEIRIICNICDCKAKSRTIDCEYLTFTEMFTTKEWLAANATGIAFDTVKFSHCKINTVPEFPELNIQRLILSYNEIDTIAPRAFHNLKSLIELDLSHNALTYASLKPQVFEGDYDPDYYEPLNLQILNLGHNNIHSLDIDVFEHFPKLDTLYLSWNPFLVFTTSTAIAVNGIANLKFLDLSYMELETLPENLFHTPRQLEILNLTGNLMTKIPPAIKSAINLKELWMDENLIVSLDEMNQFPLLSHLETLSISFMPQLRKIGKRGFSNLPSLKTFYCTNNPLLSDIAETAFSRPGREDPNREEWPPIENIYLHNNNLSTLRSPIIGRWDLVKVIDIRLNPWTCDCENQWIVDTLMVNILNSAPELSHDVICRHPFEMRGKAIKDLALLHKRLRCLDLYGNRPERDGPILIGVLVGLLIGIPLSLAIVLIYRRGCFGYFTYAGAADYSRAFYKRADLYEDTHYQNI